MFHILSRGWILFHIKTKVERQILLNNNWKWGSLGLIIKNWSVEFDANREPQNMQKILSILPELPMMFWKKEIMEAIGDKIGKFVALEEEWEQKVDIRCAKILIEVDLHDGMF